MVKVPNNKIQPRKKKKKTRGQLVKEYDLLFSRNLRLSEANDRWMCKCYTCDSVDHRKKMQCGHYITRSVYGLRWSLDNVRVQCYRCNVALSGNYIEYTLRMIAEVGMDQVERLRAKKNEIVKIETRRIEEEIERLKSENKILEKKLEK